MKPGRGRWHVTELVFYFLAAASLPYGIVSPKRRVMTGSGDFGIPLYPIRPTTQ